MNSILKIAMFAALLCAVFTVAPSAYAADINAGSALSAPSASSGVATGMTEVLKFVFLFLKFLAIIACGWGSYQMWKGEFSSGVWAYVAAIALFFSPALVDMAQSIGVKASGGSGVPGL